jgi:flagellar hook-associated protein 3 FlgL
MRVTNHHSTQNALYRLQHALRQVDDAQALASSGLAVERASDDPHASGSIMASGSSLRAIQQYQRNINSASARLAAEEVALGALSTVLERAKELGVAQANDTADAQTRQTAKAEVDLLIQQVLQLGNQQHEGEYLFGGDQSGTPPLTSATPPFSTAPPIGVRRAEIGSAVFIRANHNATDLFLTSGVLAGLDALSVALGANNQAATAQSLYGLDTAIANVQVLTGETGSQAARLEVASANLAALDTSLRAFKSNLQDVDLEKAVTELVARQTAYQAAMLATSRVLGMNLTDYLR